jgi:hypothetical protein
VRYHVGKCRRTALWVVSYNGRELSSYRYHSTAMQIADIYAAIHPVALQSP